MSERLADPRLPAVLFGIGLAGAAALIWSMQSQLGFSYDEWDFLLGRTGSGAGVLLEPHHEHIAIIPVAIYRSVLEAFGMDSPRPFQVVSTLMFCGLAALLFVYLRRRVGAWLALAALLPLLVFGPATANLIWPFQLAFTGAMIAGLGALLALERNDRTGDGFACALLIVSLSFSSLGLSFAAGVAAHVLTASNRLARAWVVLLPVGLFGLWWLGYGSEAENWLSFKNAATAASYAIDGIAASLAALLGASWNGPDDGFSAVAAGRPLLVLAVGFAGWRVHRLGRVPRALWVALAVLLSFWLLAGLNANVLRPPTTERYQLIGAVFILLVAAELLRGVRVSRAALVAVFVVAAIAAASNLEALRTNWVSFREETELQRGAISAVELLRDRVDPEFVIADSDRVLLFGNAGLYLAAVDEYGSPAYPPEQLEQAPPAAREALDDFIGRILGLELVEADTPLRAVSPAPMVLFGEQASQAAKPGCVALRAEPAGSVAEVRLPAGGAAIEGGPSGGEVAARRFGSGYALALGSVRPRRVARLDLPLDGVARAWELSLSGFSSATVCALGTSASG